MHCIDSPLKQFIVRQHYLLSGIRTKIACIYLVGKDKIHQCIRAEICTLFKQHYEVVH